MGDFDGIPPRYAGGPSVLKSRKTPDQGDCTSLAEGPGVTRRPGCKGGAMFGDHKRLYKKLEAGGHKATAEVTAATSGHAAKMTGVGLTEGTVGWKVTATISPEGAPPFTATFDCPESIYATIPVGSTMSVLYDPDDHSKVVREEGLDGGLDLLTHEIQGMTGGKGNSKDIADMLKGVMKDPAGFD